ncbi:MAG: hypothetical protein COX81_04085 [Candidatus Magasanikbacteria bacterium CG_4_10_14_0_2_um_filter_37_12]|uniref:Transcription regulator TrmB N-terminal domain-containing protein n=1 Tax=Candidatus Magasanikbacteria bacterium CG_4_10_14_0_2_um_filter_37_12 TaxID=1974637 RepID=A0A2M7V6G8_9BACT|nr:MAG: hypothetical protein COX81_04085 [Candidatus Magasanikbacteria bacterium CG_4_10_14_0_2_um_filter_37_12]
MTLKQQDNSLTMLLEHLGLSKNEALLYDIMIKYPQVTVQKLQQLSPFPRTQLYSILRQLVTRSLVSFVQQPRRTLYVAEDPQILYNLLEEKKREFDKHTHSLKEVVPNLRNQFRLAHERPGVRMFEGISEYRHALEDIIETKPDYIYSFLHISEKKKPGVEIRRTTDAERISWGIQEQTLLFDTPQANAWLSARTPDEATTFRFFPKKLSMFSVDLRIYGGKITYTTFENREPIIMMIQDQNMHDMQKNIFEYLWDKTQQPLKKLTL